MQNTIGTHYLWDVYGIDSDIISYQSSVAKQMGLLHKITGLTKLGQQFKQFDPIGVTGIILLSESHMSIHTWPEHNYAAIDIFSCRPLQVEQLTEGIEHLYDTKKVKFRKINRGQLALSLAPNQ